MDENANDVWGTISSGIKDYFSFRAAEAQAKTQAAPRGVAAGGANPFPGTFGPYPQAQTKPTPGGAGFASMFGGAGALLLALGVILVAALFARR